MSIQPMHPPVRRVAPEAPGDDDARFELWFGSLFSAKAMAFRCDRRGRVDIDALGSRARANYLAARALIGREYAYPVVRPAARHQSSSIAVDVGSLSEGSLPPIAKRSFVLV